MVNHYDLIIISEEFPIGPEMGGIGYRLYEIYQELTQTFGLKVKVLGNNIIKINPHDDFADLQDGNLNEYIAATPNILIGYGTSHSILNSLILSQKRIIFDGLMTPIETFTYQSVLGLKDKQKLKHSELAINQFKSIIKASDLILVGSYEEKLIMLGQMLMINKINAHNYKKVDKQIAILPIGFSSQQEKVANETVLQPHETINYIWNGGVWNHYSLDKILSCFIRSSAGSRSLEFLYKSGTHNYKKVLASAVQSENVKTNKETLTFYNRHTKLQNAYAFLIMANNGLESQTTLRLRLRDALLYKKPILCSSQSLLARYVANYEIGIVAKDSASSLSKAFNQLEQKEIYTQIVINIDKYAEKVKYANTLKPLVRFIKNGSK